MSFLKNITVPVKMGSLVIIKKTTEKYINKIFSSSSLQEIERNALCRTVHLLLESAINVTEKYHPKEAPEPWIHRIHITLTFLQARFCVKTQ